MAGERGGEGGERARLHVGATAQAVRDAFAAEGAGCGALARCSGADEVESDAAGRALRPALRDGARGADGGAYHTRA